MPHEANSKQARTITADDAATLVKSGDWIDYGIALCQPDAFDLALAARTSELRNVKIRSCLTMRPRAVLESDPEGEHFFWFSWHFSGYDRRQHDAGICHYIPVNLGEIPDYYHRFCDPIHLVARIGRLASGAGRCRTTAPSRILGPLPCRSKPRQPVAVTFQSSSTGLSTGPSTTPVCAPAAA